MKIWWIKYLIITSSAILIVTGIAAFFMPEELALLAGTAEGSTIFIQLYGAALIGFGFANWHVRHAAVGGIYGRALVTGNVIHFLSGSGILIGLAAGGTSTFRPSFGAAPVPPRRPLQGRRTEACSLRLGSPRLG